MIERVRGQAGAAIFARVAGPEGEGRRDRIHGTPGPRRFAPGDPVWRVHGDASMFVGGIRALLLQSLHPLAMAGVDQHSGFRGDPWGRLQRTSGFIAMTTFGTIEHADRTIAAVRGIHERVTGTAPDGRPYAASDPHLLRWVHVAEIDSFLRAHDRYGSTPLTPAERDRYVAQAAVTARLLGATDVPEDVEQLRETLRAYRPELESTPAARAAARFMLIHPPVPWTVRAPYGMLAAAAVGLLPRFARRPLGLPWLPVTEATAVRAGGVAVTRAIGWAMAPPARSTT
ncbi:oxygenase MpaB family protein [Aeromicrobium sp. HA]|uniref:oxygenase MpaB family protein n=1 Tax=unclassified Aeromicrobium TaxID=2633570 RepID=UPI0022B05A71|nr:oxygenase MpaB family protein [Aeromicrobium sp. HA]